ncbi:unnamed protein product [Adineta steineri]|uniref:PKS/mFAS DH domain-containing protein n=1 Tax=Adineta steineri TaxID=433720 RepID=A0A813TZW3_9BILA|nr:unnamed protein product [Adineta steineri]
MNDNIPVDNEEANIFLEISPHPVLAKSIRECYELTNQQQSSPLILPTLKRKENEQITLLTSLAQLTTSSHVWQQYFHTRQILPLKNHEEYFDNFPSYKFHLSSCWYESKGLSIQRLTNRIQTHSLLGIRQLNEQTSATSKSLININLAQHAFLKDHKIQDAILFPAVAYLELATTACQQLLPPKEDDQQQLTLIFEAVNYNKALILNEHEVMEVFTQIIMPMRKWYIIFCNQDNFNKYSLNQFTLHAQVLLPDIETTFLPVRIQKFIYSSKTKAKMNRSTNVEVRGKYHDNICGIDQEEIYNLNLWTFPMENKTEEPIFTFKGAVIQQVQGAHSGRWSMEQIIYDKLNLTTDLPNADHSPYLNTIIKDYYLLPSPNQILNNKLNSNSNQDLIESIEPFNELAAYYAQMAIKDLDLNQQHHPLLNAYIISGEKNELDIFFGDDEIGQSFQQIKTLIRATKIQQVFHTVCQHLQLQYEQQQQTKDNSFENYRLRIFWLTDSDCSDVLPIVDLLLNLSQQTGLLIDLYYADSGPTQLANAQQTFNTHLTNQTKNLSIIYDETIDLYDRNQDLTNSLIALRRLLVPNGLLLLLELVHILLYFDLIFGFIDQWWSSSDDNNRSLNNIQQWTTLVEQIEGFCIIESTINQNENIIFFGISVLLTTYKQVSIIFAWQLDQTLLNENNDDDLAFKQNEERLCGTLS